MELAAVLGPAREGGDVALNPETRMTTQGEAAEEVFANSMEAAALYLPEFSIKLSRHPLVTTFSLPAHA